jgi:spermidine synthase
MGRVLLVFCLALAPLGARAERVVRAFDSDLGKVFVVDEGTERFLRFGAADGADQSVIDLKDPEKAPVEYVRAAALGAACAPRVRRAVVVGLGAGVLSRALLKAAPEARVDSVELSALVVRLAREYFGLKAHPRHFVHTDDGVVYLRGVKDADLIVLDAYAGDDLPRALTTPAFFAQTAGRLSKQGVVVMNLAVEDDALEAKMVSRFAGAFGSCRAVRVDEGNLVLFGAARPPAKVAARARALDDSGALAWRVEPFARAMVDCAKVKPAAP